MQSEAIHPIVLQMEPSDEQLAAIAVRGRDVAVTAGAGAGKTRALVARYLALLAEGLPLRSVVAITFTKKAAREMRNRARREIRRYLENAGLAPDEQARWQRLYGELDAARISTIHTLCTEILRSHPAEAVLDPRFAVLDEGPAALLRSRAVDEALGWAANDAEAAVLLSLLPEKDLRKNLASLLKKRLDAAAAFAAAGADPATRWAAELGAGLARVDVDLAHLVPLLGSAFAWAGERYSALKRELDALDFDDLEAGALALLNARQDVLERWQAEVAALLVDEFQDTNARQRDLIQLLNGGRGRLFIVGDAKQSIYRFRGADVAVFRRERDLIAAAGGICLDMATSFRAHKDLVHALNGLLEPVLGVQADPERGWIEPFAPILHHRERPGAGFDSPPIELHLTIGSKNDGALRRAAQALAGKLRTMVESGGHEVFEEGQQRPLAYSHIAVLCRASSSFAHYEDAFEASGVPFLTVAGGGFYNRPEVRDLLNALRALADPTDDLALAGLLRSPACGLSDPALYRLTTTRRDVALPATLWQALQGCGASLPDNDATAAARASRLIAGLHAQVGRVSVADMLKAFLDATDYRAALRCAGDTRAARNVAKLLADAQASGLVGVGEFLESVANLKESGAREGEARATAEGAVQIMSIHAAKGLEFPMVVIGDAQYERRWRDQMLVDSELGVLLPPEDSKTNPSAIYDRAKARETDQEQAESNRLLYVAATRAQERLIISANVPQLNKNGRPGRLAGWLKQVVGPDALGLAVRAITYDAAGDKEIKLDLNLPNGSVATCFIYEPNYQSPPAAGPEASWADCEDLSVPAPLLDPIVLEAVWVDARAAEVDRDPPQRVWRVVGTGSRQRAPAWVVGSMVHEALARWRFADEGFEPWAAARCRHYGLADAAQIAHAVQETARLLERFQAHPLYADMCSADRRLHEAPYSLVAENGQVESGIVDALYQRGGRWTVVEFKTDEVRDEARLQALLAEADYLAQAERYAAAVEQLLGSRPAVILCFLDYAGGVHVYRAHDQ